jgi:hypothetical protein
MIFVFVAILSTLKMEIEAQSLHDLIDQNRANQSYRAELESYILSQNMTILSYNTTSKSEYTEEIPLVQALDTVHLSIQELTQDQLEQIVKANIVGIGVWKVISDLESEQY